MRVWRREYLVTAFDGVRALRLSSGPGDAEIARDARVPVGGRLRLVIQAVAEPDDACGPLRTLADVIVETLRLAAAPVGRSALCRDVAARHGTTERTVHTEVQRLIRARRIRRVERGRYAPA